VRAQVRGRLALGRHPVGPRESFRPEHRQAPRDDPGRRDELRPHLRRSLDLGHEPERRHGAADQSSLEPGAEDGDVPGALWVGDDHGCSVFRLDPRTYRYTRVASGGNAASWIAVNGTDVWVSNTKSGSVSRIDAVRRKAVTTVKVGVSPVNLDVIGGDVWVPDDVRNTVVRIDGDTGQVIETVPTGRNPAVVAGAVGDVWVSMYDDAQIWRIHPE
jgi:YVTN family beta-propeller protein